MDLTKGLCIKMGRGGVKGSHTGPCSTLESGKQSRYYLGPEGLRGGTCYWNLGRESHAEGPGRSGVLCPELHQSGPPPRLGTRGISTLASSLPLSFFHLLLGSPLPRPNQKPKGIGAHGCSPFRPASGAQSRVWKGGQQIWRGKGETPPIHLACLFWRCAV